MNKQMNLTNDDDEDVEMIITLIIIGDEW